MRLLRRAITALAVLKLAACVSAHPVDLADDSPANPNAAAGFVDTPTTFADYRTPDDFAARAAAEANRPQGGSMMHMHDMRGMDHTNMPGMQHGGAPQGAESQ